MKRIWTLVAVALFMGPASAPSRADDPAKKPPEKPNYLKTTPKFMAAFRPVVAKPSQSTVGVQCEGKDVALGTIVGPDGWILTKASELKGRIVCALKDGRQLDARLVGVHEKQDLAMLKIDAKDLTVVAWADSKAEEPGSWVASPGLSDDPVAVGVVSVATRNVRVFDQPRNGSGFLGIGLETAKSGVKVTQVMSGSGAEKAGIKVNDIIMALNKKPVEDHESLMNMLGRAKAGESVTVKIKRGKDELVIQATLGKRPLDRGDFQNNMGTQLSNRRAGFTTIMQHDSVLRARDCGGPLVDLDGKVIGINIARAGRTESYCLPSEIITPLLYDLMSGKLAPPPAEPSPEDRVAQLKAALQNMEAELAAAEKVVEARASLQKAETEKAAAEKKITDAKAALEKAEAADKLLRQKVGK